MLLYSAHITLWIHVWNYTRILQVYTVNTKTTASGCGH